MPEGRQSASQILERPPSSDPTMHRSTHSSTIRVRIEARRAGHPSQFTKGRKGAIARSYRDLDTTGLLIEGSHIRSLLAVARENHRMYEPGTLSFLCEEEPDRTDLRFRSGYSLRNARITPAPAISSTSRIAPERFTVGMSAAGCWAPAQMYTIMLRIMLYSSG